MNRRMNKTIPHDVLLSSTMSAAAPTYGIPRLLWENLESVLLAQSKQFVREMAGYLKVSEKELLKKVMPAQDKVHVHIVDAQQEDNQCKAYRMHGSVAVLCKQPVALYSEFCAHHQDQRMRVVPRADTTTVKRIKASGDTEPMWVADGGSVIRQDGTVVGRMDEEKGKLIVFDILHDSPT